MLYEGRYTVIIKLGEKFDFLIYEPLKIFVLAYTLTSALMFFSWCFENTTSRFCDRTVFVNNTLLQMRTSGFNVNIVPMYMSAFTQDKNA